LDKRDKNKLRDGPDWVPDDLKEKIERDILGCKTENEKTLESTNVLLRRTLELMADLNTLVLELTDRINFLSHPVYLYDPKNKELNQIAPEDEP